MARQADFAIGEDEVVLADVSAPISTLVFPLLEAVVITGVVWIALGWFDVNFELDPLVRNLVVLGWVLLVLWRFIVPVTRARRRRFVVTDRRVLSRGPRGAVDSIPRQHIHSARKTGGGISLAVYGFERPLFFDQVGKPKQVEKIINS